MKSKFKLCVVFGSAACDYADEHGVKKTAKAIDAGKVEGMSKIYELDTEHDAEALKQALNDMCGWDGCFWD